MIWKTSWAASTDKFHKHQSHHTFCWAKKKMSYYNNNNKSYHIWGGGGEGGKGLEQYFWATEWYYISNYIFIHSLVVWVVVGFVLLLTLYDTLDRTDCLWKWQISWQMTIWWQRTISWQMTISWQDSEADLFFVLLCLCFVWLWYGIIKYITSLFDSLSFFICPSAT